MGGCILARILFLEKGGPGGFIFGKGPRGRIPGPKGRRAPEGPRRGPGGALRAPEGPRRGPPVFRHVEVCFFASLKVFYRFL